MNSFPSNSFTRFLTAVTFLQHAVQKAACEEAYVTYHNYYDGQSLSTTSCSDGANGLITKFGYSTIDPMAPYVAATSVSPWNSPNCGNCYALSSGDNTVYVTAIDLCGAAPGGGMHFDMHPTAFTELLGAAGVAAGSAWVTFTEANPSNCKGNLNGGSGPNNPTPSPTPKPPTPSPTPPTNGGDCPAIPQSELPQGIWATTDSHCEPCADGQSWWPCNLDPPLCECMRNDQPPPSPTDSPTPGPTPGPTEENLNISPASPCCPSGLTGLRAWNDCTQFYHCVNGNVVGNPVDTPQGLLFDQTIQNSVWPHQLVNGCIQENCSRRREMLRGGRHSD